MCDSVIYNCRKLTSEVTDENAHTDSQPAVSSTNLIPLFEWINKSIPQDITERLEFKPGSIMRQRQSSGEWIPSFPPSRLDEGDDDAINDSPVINPSPIPTSESPATNIKSQKRALSSESSSDEETNQSNKKVKTDDSSLTQTDSLSGAVAGTVTTETEDRKQEEASSETRAEIIESSSDQTASASDR